MPVGIPAVPQSEAGMYQFLSSLKANIEALNNGQQNLGVTSLSTTAAAIAAAEAAGVSIIVSNPVLVLPAYSNGTVQSFGTANGTATVYNGNTVVTSNSVFTSTASGCTGTVNTSQGTPVAGQPAGYYQITAMTGANASLTIYAFVDGVKVSAVVNITQAESGIEIVNSLPTTNLYQGRIVFYTVDNKLYRYDGSEWIAAVAAVDVTGQIVAAQIQDGIITTAKLLPGLQPVVLVTVLPAPGVAGRVVYLTTDTQLYRDTGTAWTTVIPAGSIGGQITSNQIAANSITAGQIQAGAVTTNAMIANSISGGVIQAGTLSATAIFSNSITAQQLAANSVTALAIAAASITADKLVVGTITAAQIATNTITAAQLAVSTLAAISANLGTITAGTIVFNGGGYMKVIGIGFGANANLLEWFGPSLASVGQCTKANAIDYQAIDGTAFFGGNILITTGANGNGAWIKFPPNADGIAYIEQFGTTVATGTDPATCTFPISFGTKCQSWTASPIHPGGGGLPATVLNGPAGIASASFYSGGFACSWRAIGY